MAFYLIVACLVFVLFFFVSETTVERLDAALLGLFWPITLFGVSYMYVKQNLISHRPVSRIEGLQVGLVLTTLTLFLSYC